jgi:hypothetical protein
VRETMHKGIAIAAAAVMLITCGRKAGTVDTTKDVYEDSEAPKEQIYVFNGETTVIPWEKVPPADKWAVDYQADGKSYKSRQPILKITVLAWDKEGRPVPRNGKGYRVEVTKETPNPKYWSHSLYDERH